MRRLAVQVASPRLLIVTWSSTYTHLLSTVEVAWQPFRYVRLIPKCGDGLWSGWALPLKWRSGAGLTIGRDSKRVILPRSTILFRDSAPAHKVIRFAMVTLTWMTQLASLSGDCCAPSSTHQFITIGCLVKPDRSQRRDNLALHRQSRMRRIVRGFECSLVSTLEAIVLTGAHRYFERFA